VLVLPTRALAEAIAAEWRAVPDKAEINVTHLPLTRLATTGLDRVTVQRERVIEDTRSTPAPTCCAIGDRSVQPGGTAAQDLAAAARLGGHALRRAAGRRRGHDVRRATVRRRGTAARGGGGAWRSCPVGALQPHAYFGLAGDRARRRRAAFAGRQGVRRAQLDELYQIERWGEDPIATHRHDSIRHDIDAGARFLHFWKTGD